MALLPKMWFSLPWAVSSESQEQVPIHPSSSKALRPRGTSWRHSFAEKWLAQICDAVAAAHHAGVVHGDLTPNNILLDRNGRIVITDFGFATYSHQPFKDDALSESIVSPGGTLGFAAPEQISPAFGTIGFATDIYAIGGLAFYLLTGQSPHDSRSILDTVADEDLVVPIDPVTPAEAKLVAVVKLAMKKTVSARPHSLTELVPLLVD
jgi:eukaryotic-like serine/threonine-protein kinase